MWVRRAQAPACAIRVVRWVGSSFGSVTGEDTLSLHRDEMEALARLAHLHLPAEGAERLAHQLDDVLRWLAGLQAVDVEGVPEWSLDAVAVALREDVAGVVLARDEVLAGVPEADDGQVVVPSFRGSSEE